MSLIPKEDPIVRIFEALADLCEIAAKSDDVSRRLRGLILQHHHPLVSEVSVLAETATLLNHATQHFERVAKLQLTRRNDS